MIFNETRIHHFFVRAGLAHQKAAIQEDSPDDDLRRRVFVRTTAISDNEAGQAAA